MSPFGRWSPTCLLPLLVWFRPDDCRPQTNEELETDHLHGASCLGRREHDLPTQKPERSAAMLFLLFPH